MSPFLDIVVATDKHGFVLSCVWGVDMAGSEGFLLLGKLPCGWG